MSNQPSYIAAGFKKNATECDVSELTLSGTIPEWIDGFLLRNGPGMVHADKSMRHWFDGLAMLHQFNIKRGNVSYKSKFIDCEAYRSFKATGKFLYSDFATDPCRSLFAKIQTLFSKDPMITDSAKVNVGAMNGSTYALGEPLMQIRIDPDTLQTLGVFDYGLTARSRMTTAHPHHDHDVSYNLVVEYGPINHYSIYSMGSESRKVASVPVYEPAYLHSFGMSDRYFIIAEFPLVVQSLKLAFRFKPFIENFKWKPENGSRFIIIDRQSGKRVASIPCDAFFSFHHVNAFEQDGKLTVDLVSYEDASIVDRYYVSRLEESNNPLPKGRLERFVLDVESSNLLSRNIISDECMELPYIEYGKRHGDPGYRYVYACGIDSNNPEGFYNQLIRVDIASGQHLKWSESGCYPGEPVFVPSPMATGEDQGVVLSVVLNPALSNSFLIVLDASNMKELARAQVPYAIPFGYHGTFIKNHHENHV